MKIGILTHYLHYGYGGVLQNFALQRVLESLGHTPITLRVASQRKQSIFFSIIRIIKRFFHNLLGHDVGITPAQDAFVSKNVEQFIKKYIKTTKFCSSTEDFRREVLSEGCDALIAGSDQIWRASYEYVYECYFDFAYDLNIKRIAYAASIAVDHWEYSEHQTRYIRPLVQKFDAISVREESGIELCKRFLNVNAELVLDPTLLLDKDIYEQLVFNENEPKSDGNLFSYILDKTDEKEQIINYIANKYKLQRFECMPIYKTQYNEVKKHPDECVYPNITKWLRSFMDAELVITDSFHGTVFSIIFNKPFYVILNKERGAARFTSILNLFGIEDRIIHSMAEVGSNVKKIDWESINRERQKWQEISFAFIKQCLKQ